jgi:DNA-directed RNA polymerase subunit E'/Rpb7
MLVTRQIQKRICVEPEHLHSGILDYIKTKLAESCKGECSREDGFFIKVLGLKGISDNNIISDYTVYDNRITSNCQTIFSVVAQVETLKPEVGVVYTGEVFISMSSGIVLLVEGIMKVLIPSPVDGYIFDLESKTYRGDNRIIAIGDSIKVKVAGTRYRNKNFSTFGKLVE